MVFVALTPSIVALRLPSAIVTLSVLVSILRTRTCQAVSFIADFPFSSSASEYGSLFAAFCSMRKFK
jgi:hypothetical protein